jgi:hypothetical protein
MDRPPLPRPGAAARFLRAGGASANPVPSGGGPSPSPELHHFLIPAGRKSDAVRFRAGGAALYLVASGAEGAIFSQ